MKTKDEFRDVIRERRRGLDAAWINENSDAIERRVAELNEFRKASMVAAYVAMPGEVRSDAIIERCWREQKGVCVPAYQAETGRYGFVKLERESRMVTGPSKILEPEDKSWIPVDDMELVLVPGLAFDSSGGRVGHGRGHYDRILEQARAGTPFKMALAFEFQMFERVPIDPSDVRMDVVVTEKRVIRAQSAASAVR